MSKPKNVIPRGRIWYANYEIAGKQYRYSLKTSDEALAKRLAAADIREVMAGNFAHLDRRKGTAQCSTIGEYFAAFDLYWQSIRKEDRTRRDYENALLRILKATLPLAKRTTPEALDDALKRLRLSTLTAELVEKWQAARLEGIADKEALNKRRLANESELRQARSLFGDKILKSCFLKGIRVPDLEGFMGYRIEKGKTRGYRSPSVDQVQRTIEDARKLMEIDRPRWFAFLLCGGVGLRAGEAQAATWDWVKPVPLTKPQLDGTFKTEIDIQLHVDVRGDFGPKGRQRSVSIDPLTYQSMVNARDSAFPHIIPLSSKTARAQVFRESARWLRQLGWDTGRPNHHLRKFFANILREVYGLDAAQAAMGHASSKTTEQVYTGTGGSGKTFSPLSLFAKGGAS